MTITADIVIPDASPPLIDEVFDACPLAEAHQPWVGAVMMAYRRVNQLGLRLVDIYTDPTVGLLDALDAFDAAVQDLRGVERAESRAMADASAAARGAR